MKFVMLYITAPGVKEAKKIGTVLVKERLAACANVIDKMQSIYWWNNKIEKGTESLLIAKTKASLAKKAIDRVKAIHSYDCPCIVAVPIVEGNPAYLQWITDETI